MSPVIRMPATWIVAAVVLGGLVAASAAAIAITTDTLGSGSAPLPCDNDGVTLTQTLSGTNVASVTVAGIASPCGGGNLSLTVNNGAASGSGGPLVVPAGGGSLTVTISPQVALDDAHYTTLLLQGP